MNRPTLSLVIPVYNEEAVIPELQRRLQTVLLSLSDLVESWEVIFVNDGSQDASLDALKACAELESRFKILSLARNFGHQMAITAGLDRAQGDAVVIMDADLQDPPEVVRDMLLRWRSGFDVVYGVRLDRAGETWFKTATAALFYRVTRALVGVSIPADAGDFRLLSRPVVLALRALRERHRFVRSMVSWVGFRQTAIFYSRATRFAGETKYPLGDMIRFAIDGITSFSIVPLRFATWLGVFSGLVAVATSLWAVYLRLFTGGAAGTSATIVIVVALAAAAQLLMIGVLGEYIGRIYEEVKRRPLYITAEETNFTTTESTATRPSTSAAPKSVQRSHIQ
jgi:dolichol-phosphate mannosyltransferase